ncbi:hypothetical protein SAMN02745247_02889 [Butyrivibrio hungatei DSM 14810]|uniref:Uncharacterized protein n=2 Tax=Butyrivibrio hungatei TaxID=185008 RepID=A0A1D9NYM1_9FIRM|nr:hypothetical protein [Butyrivibrio hungatei]AOZ95005.1 hypothetical protein bhn_III057 [Butyrivibrio hungatei]SHN65089.1 hypothetical protein SAMN02745247_02889 [Butyrivibrio hungatei DSM 14810]
MDVNHKDINSKIKKPAKVIDAVNYNGKYMDPSILKGKIISVTAILTTLIAISLAIMFLC